MRKADRRTDNNNKIIIIIRIVLLMRENTGLRTDTLEAFSTLLRPYRRVRVLIIRLGAARIYSYY